MNKGDKAYKLAGIERVAKSLKVEHITQPVPVPVVHLKTLKTWRVKAWEAFQKGRKGRTNNPITRDVLEDISGVPKRTQQRYEKRSKAIHRKRNIGIIRMPSTHITGLREHTNGTYFPVCDDVGQALPNSYYVDVETAPKGMTRRVNKSLRDSLLSNSVKGDEQRLFYGGGSKDAERAMRQEGHPDEVFGRHPKDAKSGAAVWEKVS